MHKLFTMALIGSLLATAACSKSEDNKDINAQKTMMDEVGNALEDVETGINEYLYYSGAQLSPSQQMIVDALQPCEKSTETQAKISGANCPIDYVGEYQDYGSDNDGDEISKIGSTKTLAVFNSDFETLVKFNYLRFTDSSTFKETATQQLANSTLDGYIKSAKWGNDTKYVIKNNYVGNFQGSKDNVAFKMDMSLSIKSEKLDVSFLMNIIGTSVTNNGTTEIQIISANCSLGGAAVNCMDMIGNPESKVTKFQASFK